jgi:hypothetical protein
MTARALAQRRLEFGKIVLNANCPPERNQYTVTEFRPLSPNSVTEFRSLGFRCERLHLSQQSGNFHRCSNPQNVRIDVEVGMH